MRRGVTYPPEALTREEVEAMLRACGRSRTGRRNRALIVLLWRAGLRVGEALALEPRDLDVKRGTVNVRHGKGDRSRVVALDAVALPAVETWLDVRPARAKTFLCTLDGGPVIGQYARAMLRRVAKRAEIPKRVTPHQLRHTFAIELAHEGAPPHFIRDLLGHSSLATTDRYLMGLGASHAVEFARARA